MFDHKADAELSHRFSNNKDLLRDSLMDYALSLGVSSISRPHVIHVHALFTLSLFFYSFSNCETIIFHNL